MKANKSNTTAKGSTPAKATPSTKNVPAAKAAPGPKPKQAKALPLVASPPQDSATPPPAHSPDEVALRAYHNFQKRGSADGDHHGDWLRAEAELTAERSLVRA